MSLQTSPEINPFCGHAYAPEIPFGHLRYSVELSHRALCVVRAETVYSEIGRTVPPGGDKILARLRFRGGQVY